ncbi:glycosyltransferase [Paenibacillus macerans]|uniref:glycosyltransferase n=1 Tax=Paenibacillus macerans TaxID=44252 RepID=UPI002E23A4BD|nr:glycosyltransferase [Paenibacillus macerans]
MLVSVLINNYNYEDFIVQCVDSVLNQTYKDIEIIVYDDGSTDHSLEKLSHYSDLKVISKANHGKSNNFNQMNAVYQAFLQSKGEYIFLLDSDDWFRNNKVKRVIDIFKSNPELEVVQHALEEVDAQGQSTNAIIPVFKDVQNYKEYIYSTESLFHLFSMTSGLAFKRTFFERVMPIPEDGLNHLWLDTRLMILAALTSNIYTVREALSCYRRHGKNAWGKMADPDVHKVYTGQLYDFFNSCAQKNDMPTIQYTTEGFLENTYFYNQIDIEKCKHFIGDDHFWIWGAGEAGQSVCHALMSRQPLMIGFVDSEAKKQGQLVLGKQVFAPQKIINASPSKALISPYHAYNPIKATLTEAGWVEGMHFIDPYFR